MTFRMLLSPEFQQKGRHLRENDFGAMYFGVAARTKRNHQVKQGAAWHPMMDRDRAFIPAGSTANPTSVAVPFEHGLPQTSEYASSCRFNV